MSSLAFPNEKPWQQPQQTAFVRVPYLIAAPPRSFDEAHPLQVVVIHGDPTKPNRILPGGKWDEDDFETIEKLKVALNTLTAYKFRFLCSHDTLVQDLKALRDQGFAEMVLQFCDEGFMNDPKMELHVTAILETLRIPYTGTGAHSIAFSYDKDFILGVCTSLGVPVPKSRLFFEGEELDHGLDYPVILKPNSTDGSYGITRKSVCHNQDELQDALKMIRSTFRVHGPVMVQEYLPGRDVTYAIIGNPPDDLTVLPVTEEDYSAVPSKFPRILGFESKWLANSPYWFIKTVACSLPAAQQDFIARCSQRVFRRLGYRDYARFDWRLDAEGHPRLLEVNPNCGWCWDGHMAKTAATAGLSYAAMIDRILRVAVHRYQTAYKQVDEAADIEQIMAEVERDGCVVESAPASATKAAAVAVSVSVSVPAAVTPTATESPVSTVLSVTAPSAALPNSPTTSVSSLVEQMSLSGSTAHSPSPSPMEPGAGAGRPHCCSVPPEESTITSSTS